MNLWNGHLFRYEWRRNRKSFLVCMFVILVLNGLSALTAKAVMNEQMVAVVKTLPKVLTESLGIYPELMMTFEGFASSKGYILFVLMLGIYAVMWSGLALARERDRGTADLLFSLPVRRSTVLFSKMTVHLVHITLVFAVNLAVLLVIGEVQGTLVHADALIYVFTAGYLISLAFAGVGYLLTVLFRSERSALMTGISLVLLSYLLHVLSESADTLKWLDKGSIFSLFEMHDMMIERLFPLTGMTVSLGVLAFGMLFAMLRTRWLDL